MHHRFVNFALVAICVATAAWLVVVGESTRAMLRDLAERTDLTLNGVSNHEDVPMETLTDCWEYETAGGGCATKTVSTVRNEGESQEDFEKRHDGRVKSQMQLYPPKVQ